MRDVATLAHEGGPESVARTAQELLPTVDLRIVLFTVAQGRLRVAFWGISDQVRLPREEPRPNENLDASARRIVRAIGLREQYLEQLYTLSVQESDRWSLIVSYLGLVCSGQDLEPSILGVWHDANALPALSQADRMVVDYAKLRLRAKLDYTTIAFHLLPASFTLSELQGTYEAVLDRDLDKRNFRRRMTAAGILEPLAGQRREGSHRPALLYRSRVPHDRETYLTPAWTEES